MINMKGVGSHCSIRECHSLRDSSPPVVDESRKTETSVKVPSFSLRPQPAVSLTRGPGPRPSLRGRTETPVWTTHRRPPNWSWGRGTHTPLPLHSDRRDWRWEKRYGNRMSRSVGHLRVTGRGLSRTDPGEYEIIVVSDVKEELSRTQNLQRLQKPLYKWLLRRINKECLPIRKYPFKKIKVRFL